MNQLWQRDSSSDASITDSSSGYYARHRYIIKQPDDKGTFSFCIPLKHIFGFCENYDKVVYGFKHTLTLVRKSDDDAVFRTNTTTAGKIDLTKLSFLCHTLHPLFRS